MTTATTLTITAAALLLLGSAGSARANVEAGEGGAVGLSLDNLTDKAETLFNQVTEQAANVDMTTADQNISAFLTMLQQAEGTAGRGDPYRVCYGYRHFIQDMSEHPAASGEWRGERLPDAMCANAGFGPGCISTAAGAYQIIRPTWAKLKTRLGLPDFSAASQDAAAVELIRQRGALEDVKAGRLSMAIGKCRNEWASLPGNNAKQGQRSIDALAAWFQNNGGTFA